MPIRDAITRANSPHHIYFLVAAYIENMALRCPHGMSPFRLTALPIGGIDDLQRRRDAARGVLLTFLRDAETAGSALMGEYHEVLTLALERLAAVGEETTACTA